MAALDCDDSLFVPALYKLIVEILEAQAHI